MNLYQKYNEISVPTIIHITLCIFALAFWTLFGIIALPLLLVYHLFKSVVSALIFYQKHGEPLASEDVPFTYEHEHNKNFSVSLFLVKGNPSVEKLRKLFNDRVVMNGGHPSYKRLRKIIKRKYGCYFWADEENVDISQHILIHKGEPPANEAELEKLFGEIVSKPLPEGISPWQVVCIPLKMDGYFAFFCKAHHIIGDGISMVSLFSKVMDHKPVLLKPSEKLIKKYKTSAIKRVLHALFTGPLTLLTLALSSGKNPFSRTSKAKGELKVVWSEEISLKKIKEVKTKIGATINDVVTGCMAGALRRYIETTKGQCTEDVQVAVSINTRPPSMLLLENLPLENNATGVILRLPVTGGSVLERIKMSKQRMDKIKKSSEFVVFGFIFNLVLANVPDFLVRLTINSLNRHCCLILSNVPGPLNQMVIGGDKVTSIMTWPPLVGGTGMSVAIFTYADTMRFNVMADTLVCPNPKLFTDYFEMEINKLFKLYDKKDN